MKERIDERIPSIETESNEEAKAYQELLDAENEEERLFKEMHQTLDSAPDRLEAESVICEQLAPTIAQAQRRTSAALRKWLASIRSK